MKNSPDDSSTFGRVGSGADEAERTVLDWPRHAGVLDRLLPVIESRVRRRRQRRLGAVATGLAALLLIGFFWPSRPADLMQPALMAVASPLVLPTTEVLSDGSVVQLREGARISVAFDEGHRRVILQNGEAYFQVTKNARRPFIVVARGVEVRAVGTAFGVQVGAKAVEVLVTEGRVAVDQGHPADTAPEEPLAVLDANNRVSIGSDQDLEQKPEVVSVTAAEIDERLMWRVPRLDLSSTPLDEVIAVFNQHGRVRFVLADPALGRLRISGVLRVDHPELLVRLLERDLGIRTEHRTADEIRCYKSP